MEDTHSNPQQEHQQVTGTFGAKAKRKNTSQSKF